MKRHLKTFVISAALFSFALATGTALAVSLPQGPALFETSLQSRISATDTTMTLVANSVRGGGTLSGYNCFTVDEGRTDAEYICGSVSGTSVTSLERAVSPSNGTTTISSIAHSHRVGADVKVTDFPLIQRLRNLLNAAEQFPSLLSYVTGTVCTGLSPNNTICDKGYFDTVVASGAPNANETTKGIVEAGTQIEMASSTNLGSTLAGLYVQTRYSTSSPYTSGIWNVITQNDGKISPNFIATSSSYTYNFGGPITFTATSTLATSTQASSTVTQLNVKNLSITGSTTAPFGTPTFIGATTTDTTVTNTSAETTYGQGTGVVGTVQGGTMSAVDFLRARLFITNLVGASGSSQLTIRMKLGGTTVCSLATDDIAATNLPSVVEFSLNATSTTAEACRTTMTAYSSLAMKYSESFAAVDLSNDKTVTFTAQWNGASVSNSVTVAGAEITKY